VDIFRKVDTMSKPMAETPKRRPRRRFDDDFKAQAVRLVLDEGKSVGSVARDLDLTETALREWVNRARADRTHGKTGLTTAEREELARLRKENRILRVEREILKNQSRALEPPDLWARNSTTYARAPEAVAVRFLVTSRAR
jgi:transposase